MKFSSIESIHFASIDSTNNYAKEFAKTCRRDVLYVIWADEQTSGRGREGRLWHSPLQQNLYATYLFFVSATQIDIANISQVMALAAQRAILQHDIRIVLKWPNDLMIHKNKVGGILTEVFRIPSCLAVAVGIGINVNMTKESLSAIGRPATALQCECGRAIGIEDLLETLTREFSTAALGYIDQGFAPFLEAYCQSCSHRAGEEITFHVRGKKIKGSFMGITKQGMLQLQLPCGEIVTHASGEIWNEA
jgi:biotin-[acetyl-CoA-carboxylase] ligase BirA-like protein